MFRLCAFLAASAFLIGACGQSSTTGPVPSLGPPVSFGASAVASGAPSASAAASVFPSGSAPVAPSVVVTASPSVPPSSSVGPTSSVDPTTEDALAASFLHAEDLPTDATGGLPQVTAPTLTDAAFKANNGLREASATWSGSTFTTLFDIRFQFRSAGDASAFLDADETGLSEGASGLKKFDSLVGNADDVRAYHGSISLLGVTTQNYNYLLRTGNFVAKVFIAGSADLKNDDAETIATHAATRMAEALGIAPATPSPSPSPSASFAPSATISEAPSVEPSVEPSPSASFNDDELDILQHVPDPIQPGCEPVDTIYGSEIDSVRCINDGVPSIDYTSFLVASDMADEFKSDATAGDSPTTSKGTCAEANYESTYTINGTEAGEIRCMIVTGSQTGTKYKVIEWTDTRLLILSYMSTADESWDDLIAFWQSSAGPVQ